MAKDADNNPDCPLLGTTVNSTILEHRHLLPAKKSTITCFLPMRILFVCMSCLACFVVYSTRVSMSIALVCMVNQTAILQKSPSRRDLNGTVVCPSLIVHNQNQTDDDGGGDPVHSSDEDGPFVWDEELQGIILSSFFWGYVITQFPGGVLADKAGGKWILAWCQLATSVLTMLLPLAARADVSMVILLRFLCGLAQGVTFPTLNSLFAKWAPKPERTILMTLSTIGCTIGIIVTFPVSAFVCKSNEGWPLIFYLFGGIGVAWFALWVLCMRDEPSKHPWISLEEKTFIEANTTCNENETVIIPWGAILKSPAFYSLCIVNFALSFKYFMLLTQLPTYLKVVMDFNLEQNGLINIMPYLLAGTVAVFASIAADFIKNSGTVSITTVRKSLCFIGTFCSAVGLAAVPFAGCNRALVITLLWVSIGIDGLNAAGLETVSVDMAPKMAGTITGIANSCSAAGGIVAPYVVGILTQNNNTKSSWDLALYLSSGVCLTGLCIFLLFGSAEVQPWSRLLSANDEEDDPDTDVLFDRNHWDNKHH